MQSAFATIALSAVVASAAPLPVQSYDMQNGQTGIFTYWDDTYNGSGNPTASGNFLSGGTGDLADGVVAISNWDITPALYVGWEDIVPDIVSISTGPS